MVTSLSWIVALVGVVFSIWLTRPLAIKIGLVDIPGGRKQHDGEIPLIGGLAIFIGFTFAILCLHISLANYRSFIAGSALLVFIGILDDFHELSANARFIAQIIAACFMAIWGGNKLIEFGNLLFFGNIHLIYLSLPITVFAVVGIINAINMMDGIDGLAASLALTELCLLTLVAYLSGSIIDVKLLLVLIFALIGFLIFNFRFPWRKQAHVFMGDSGSMFIGFALAWFLVSLSQGTHPAVTPVTMLWIMIIPLFDIGRLLIRRALEKRSPFRSGRDHLHHILAAKGYNPIWITTRLCALNAIAGLIGIVGSYLSIPQGIMFIAFVLLFIGYYVRTNWRNIK